MNKNGAWVDVVKKTQDTVVQVFADIAKFNWFEPFKPPAQVQSQGSGFFISEQGHVVTNFHVVNEAASIRIQIPAFGQEQFEVKTIGVYPEMDIALLQLKEDDLARVAGHLGAVPYLKLGDSDQVFRTQGVLALGYPLGSQGMKSTEGIVSGFEKINFVSYIQTTAALNPGNSGGPSLNHEGEVIGINFAGVLSAQNVGFIIPINEVKSAIKDLHGMPLVRKPYLGGIFSFVNDDLINYLGNPEDGGFYVAEVFEDSSLQKAGIEAGDMIYEINEFKVDKYGEITVPWAEDKISLFDLLHRYEVGDAIKMIVYRRGERKDVTFKLERGVVLPIRFIYPQYEKVDYEIFGGMVIMQLTMNHVDILVQGNPLFYRYVKVENQDKPKLLITSILPNSQAHQCRCVVVGNIITEVNGVGVKTLSDLREAVLQGKDTGYMTLKFENKVFTVLSLKKILAQEPELALSYLYKVSELTKLLS